MISLKPGYGEVWNLPDCVLQNRWATFDAYLDDIAQRLSVQDKASA